MIDNKQELFNAIDQYQKNPTAANWQIAEDHIRKSKLFAEGEVDEILNSDNPYVDCGKGII